MKNPIFKMHDTVRANWNLPKLGIARDQEFQVKDVSHELDVRTGKQSITAYRLSAPSLREDVWVGKPDWSALSKAPLGLHADEDLANATFVSVPISGIKVGDLVICQDPYNRTSYGMGGKGVFEVLTKPRVGGNVLVLSSSQSRPDGPIFRTELKIPLSHVQEVKRVHYT